MAEVTLEETPRSIQDIFNRAFSAFERKNYDYSIDLFTSLLEQEPGLLQARRFLRSAEIKKRAARKSSSLSSALTLITCLPVYAQASMLAAGKNPEKGVIAAEKLLRKDPVHPRFVLLFALAAANAGMPEAAIQTLEMVFERSGANVEIAKRLAELYAEVGQTGKARECYERLVALRPKDPEMVKLLKDAIAIDSMEGNWKKGAAEGGSFRDIMKDSSEATLLEQESKAVKSEKDAEALIRDAVAKLEGEPDNINYYRALGRLYAQQGMFDEAIEVLQVAVERNPGDPEMERSLSAVYIQRFDKELALLKVSGDEEAFAQLELERAQFVLDDLGDRVERYPNDLGFRFGYGTALLENGHINEAIQQFQAAQRSPKHRTRALYSLAICFKEKAQLDMAAEQLQTALAEMPVMDENKKDVLYELGVVNEAMGKDTEALRFFKQIYQVDIGYKDVSERVESRG